MSEESTEVVKILVAEDHVLTRLGLRVLLKRQSGMQIVGEAGNGVEAVRLATELSPNVVLMDVRMPIMNGIEAAKQIKEQHPGIKIMMLTSQDKEQDIFASLAAGAAGYCLKDISPERLFAAIYMINAGDVWMDAGIASKVLQRYGETGIEKREQQTANGFTASSPNDRFLSKETTLSATQTDTRQNPLSAREQQVLRLIVEGLSNQQIADRLTVSLATAKAHVRSILGKLSVDDRTQAAVIALRQGLLG